jgi:hypothetical protein
LFTDGVTDLPTIADIVDDNNTTNGFNTPNVTVLADQTKSFAGYVTNNAATTKAFWFAVRAGAAQPTTFLSGSGPTLLVPVNPVTKPGPIGIAPETPPLGYEAEDYKFYGFPVTAGVQIYISIS